MHKRISPHGDYDHMGEAENLINNFNVENVIFNCGESNELETRLIQTLEKKNILYHQCLKELNLNHQKIQFLNTEIYGDENEDSNVIYMNWQGRKLLFMGDAGIDRERDLLKKYELKNIDVLKVGHHGSKTSSSEEFIRKLKPKYSIISVGRKNRYGHPHQEVLNYLKNSKVYRTDQDGIIMFEIHKNKLEIDICRPQIQNIVI